MAEIYRAEIPSGIKFVPIETAASQTLVVGVAGKQIVCISTWFVVSASVNVKFQTSSGPIDLTGPAYCVTNGGVVLPMNPGGWFATSVGDSLLINLSAGIPIGGSLSYILV